MNSVETEPESLSVATLAPVHEKVVPIETRRWSLMASMKQAAKRFVKWIDKVDVDGQEHWN